MARTRTLIETGVPVATLLAQVGGYLLLAGYMLNAIIQVICLSRDVLPVTGICIDRKRSA